jgi:hypothetical protein
VDFSKPDVTEREITSVRKKLLAHGVTVGCAARRSVAAGKVAGRMVGG